MSARDPENVSNARLNRTVQYSELQYDQRLIAQAEMPARRALASRAGAMTRGHVYGTDLGHNNGPAFNAHPDDTSERTSHSTYDEAYRRVF